VVGTSIVTAAIVSSRPPPPPLVVEEPPPRAGYVWQPGYWSLEHDEWVWVEGRWIARYPGYDWEPSQWAMASYDGTVASYRQTVLTAFQEVEDELAALRILSQEGRQQDQAVASAQTARARAEDRYKFGVDSYVNVITAQSMLLSNQRTAMNIRMQQMTASVLLIKALGGAGRHRGSHR